MRIVIFISPLIQIIIFGYAANTDIQNIPTAVYDLDNTKESRDVVREFTYSKYFKVKYHIKDDKELTDLIDRTKIVMAIRFNRGFGRKLLGNKSAPVQLVVDGTDSNTAGITLGYAGQIMERYMARQFEKRKNIYLAFSMGYYIKKRKLLLP